MKILVLCTGNSCRSQMAEGFLRSFNEDWQVHSGGTHPAARVSPYAVRVMKEVGIDISYHTPTLVDHYLNDEFDYVITVCDNAKESCPVFTGQVKNRLHIGFPDPADATGTEEEILAIYRRVRDSIGKRFYRFYLKVSHENKKERS
ncbi:MAG: arsenate reductase ArsC [Lentimicrobiaceae bacterium]|nr:arsenate reductase ArsC [Lentimicrobiaceae bacterium]